MNLRTAIEQIRFWTGTPDDLSGKNVNQLFSNNNIVRQLQFALNEYARTTKAIEDIHSFPLNTSTPFVDAPDLALRSEAYRFIVVIINGYYYPADITSLNNSFANFPVPGLSGITSWFQQWKDKIYTLPMKSVTGASSTLNGGITATDTTITVVSTTNFLAYNGKLTLENEKIQYLAKTATQFTGCVRGCEGTTAAAHVTATAIAENTVWIFYSRLHRNIAIIGDTITDAELATDLEIPEEHVETVLKYVSYNLLLKIDPSRAGVFRIDYTEFLEKAKQEIRKGRSRIHQTRGIRGEYLFEQSLPYGNSLVF